MSYESAQEPNVVVSVSNVAKSYNVYPSPRDRLKQFVLPRLQRSLGLPPRQYHREFRALQNVSFTVQRGETFGIVGKNGSGKSTLLQIICGTIAPTTGDVHTVGRLAALLELGAGFNPEFTGRENVYMNGTVLGLTNEQIDDRFDKIAGFADIGEFIDQPVKTYSSGMYVRLAFGVIANVDADILVIDEALAVGDAYFVQKCMRFLHGFMENGTLLFVSHDTSAVQRLCSRALLLGKGEVEMISSPKEVAKHYLSKLYSEFQDIDGTGNSDGSAEPTQSDSKSNSVDRVSDQPESGNRANELPRDMRQDLVNNSPYRSDFEVFRFQPDADSFGTGLVTIDSVQFLDTHGRTLKWIVGGEDVVLQIQATTRSELIEPIIGFEMKDRLGQTVFGDNTYLSTEGQSLVAKAGSMLNGSFSFRMPAMQAGDYSVAVAIAEGTQTAHTQHQWMHDALVVRIHTDSICFGLVGIPMRHIDLQIRNG
ncbi:MAG: ABC transporter ATP-binding protein [Burkholderiaceae bacterium]